MIPIPKFSLNDKLYYMAWTTNGNKEGFGKIVEIILHTKNQILYRLIDDYGDWMVVPEKYCFEKQKDFLTFYYGGDTKRLPDLSSFAFSARADRCLYNGHIRTTEQLISLTSDQLLQIQTLGERTLKEIKEKLSKKGLHLKTV